MKNKTVFVIMLCVFFTVFSNLSEAKTLKDSLDMPIVTFTPNYPKQSGDNTPEGFVKLDFTITETGSVKDVVVVDSKPKEIFDREAIRAILKYKFAPKIKNGKAVALRATQVIDFKRIPLQEDELNNDNKTRALITQAKIRTKRKYKNLEHIDLAILDKNEKFKPEIISWQQGVTKIPDFDRLKQTLTDSSKEQFKESRGLFKQFYKFYTSASHPPVLISEYSSLDFSHAYIQIKFKSIITINADGRVNKYKIIKFPKEKLYYKNIFEHEINNLKFLPAQFEGKPIASDITLEGTFITTTPKDTYKNWLLSKSYLKMKPPSQWVRLALLIKKNGKVENIRVVESNDEKIEKSVIDAVKKYKFQRKKSAYQIIKVMGYNM